MNHFDELTGSPPPPAYCEQEFDQKVSRAAQLSLATHQAQPVCEEDAWEVWDEDAFEAAAGKLSTLSLRDDQDPGEGSNQSSRSEASGSGIQPLRIYKKKSPPPVPAGKQKPSWLAEAEGDGASSSRAVAPVASAAPAYTPDSSSSTSPTTFPNPYSEQDWAAAAPSQALPDPYADQHWSAEESATTPPPLSSHLPPPPFLPSADDRLLNPYDNARRISAPVLSNASQPSSTYRPTSMPPAQTNPQISFSAETAYLPQIAAPQNNTPLYPVANESRYSLQPSPVTRPPNYGIPSQLTPRSTANAYRHSALPQSTAIPRLDFDLSAAYGKSPATRANDTQPQQVFNAAAFYNSAVSAHLGPHPKHAPIEQRRLSHQISPNASLYNFQSNQPGALAPNRFSQLPPGAGTTYNPHTVHNPVIRSPTPSYPVGAGTTMPQMLAAASDVQYDHQPVSPHAMGREQVTWTGYNPYR